MRVFISRAWFFTERAYNGVPVPLNLVISLPRHSGVSALMIGVDDAMGKRWRAMQVGISRRLQTCNAPVNAESIVWMQDSRHPVEPRPRLSDARKTATVCRITQPVAATERWAIRRARWHGFRKTGSLS